MIRVRVKLEPGWGHHVRTRGLLLRRQDLDSDLASRSLTFLQFGNGVIETLSLLLSNIWTYVHPA